ncbi:hypothetical protein Rsub_03810 [Raphidocelis subcapitata]|uniref:Expansin-like EG45 domain-containing protein n=1 Tax=Raphidocelis subcapitata TaxID=307507 RepID=A0A2V0P1J0_9CHLO|nr:hypothetical protein Rsub_03810 [Raphidocelis subcapitata]|eukprot:GBF90955.1 hypothetical protein Rsub_03810 [Raphidocelis subcapitata]
MAKRVSTLALAAAAAVLLLAGAPTPTQAADSAAAGEWSTGRATFYDDNTQGSCRYGTKIPSMYAAWPDVQEGFGASCGRCLEVACIDSTFNDGYGKYMDRSSACYDQKRSVVVKIVDSCPCIHQNAYSNRRWCCGDMKHVDLGRAAFKALADEKWGVIGLRWRYVDCSRLGGSPGTAAPLPKPAYNPAPPAAKPTTPKAAPSKATPPPPAAVPAVAQGAAPAASSPKAAAPRNGAPSWARYAQRYAGGGGDGGDYVSAIKGLVDRWAGRYVQGAV